MFAYGDIIMQIRMVMKRCIWFSRLFNIIKAQLELRGPKCVQKKNISHTITPPVATSVAGYITGSVEGCMKPGGIFPVFSCPV